MHGLPASMKKLREMSLDRSRPQSPKNYNQRVQNDEENCEVDLNLKFFNKNAMQSMSSTNIMRLKKNPNLIEPNHIRNMKKVASNKHMTPMTRFKKIVTHKKTNSKNVSFENSPRRMHPVKSSKNVGKYTTNMIESHQPADYIEDEVNSQMMRETFSQIMPNPRQNLYPESEMDYDEPRIQPIDSVTIRQQREELEMERIRLERVENPDYYNQKPHIQREYSLQKRHAPSPKHSQINESMFETRSRSQHHRSPNNNPKVYQTQELPSIHNRGNSVNKSIEKDIAELKMQLSALTQKQQAYFSNDQKIIEPKYEEPLPKFYKPHQKFTQDLNILPQLTFQQMAGDQKSMISIGATPKSTIPQNIQKPPKIKPNGTTLMIDVPESELESDNQEI